MIQDGIKVFVSYAHADNTLRIELDKHLSQLKREKLISVWHDQDISAGTEWEYAISIHLDAAQIILLLISPDFIASEYCYSIEMKRAMERHASREARVIPIILRPTDWEKAPFGSLQALPTNAKPVVSTNWHSQDEAFLNITRGIREAVDQLLASSLVPTSPISLSPPLVSIPSSKKREIKITMLGAPGAGKTSFMLAMYATLRLGVSGFTLVTEDLDVDLDLSNAWDQLVETEDVSRWPNQTYYAKAYSFSFCYALRELLSFSWLDYRGGALSARSTDTDTSLLTSHLQQSSHIFLCISAEHLIEPIHGREAVIRRETLLQRILTMLIQLPQDEVPPTIVIVVTKFDLVHPRREEDVLNDVQSLFHLLFVPGSAWTVAICPVTLGKSLWKNPISGMIDPENVYLPLLFSLYQTLTNSVDHIQSQERTASRKMFNELSQMLPLFNKSMERITDEVDSKLEIYYDGQKATLIPEKVSQAPISVANERKVDSPVFSNPRDELLSKREVPHTSKWAPVVYGRTLSVDYRFLAVPSTFTEQDIAWMQPFILGTFEQFGTDQSPRWAIFKNETYCVIGVNCLANQISSDMNKDSSGRLITVFLGYVTHQKTLPAPPQRELMQFSGLYQFLRENWLEKTWQTDLVNRYDYVYELPARTLHASKSMQLNTDESVILLWPRTYDEELWAAASAHHGPISLCLGLSQQRLAQRGPFLNASILDIAEAVSMSKFT